MRRDFDLPETDTEYLDDLGLDWETVVEGKAQWLLVHERPTNNAYDPPAATTAIHIVPGYPDSQLDMVWFSPALALKCGKQVRKLSNQKIDGRDFQRWSRHRTPANAWRPGVDDLATHLLLVDHWLAREVA